MKKYILILFTLTLLYSCGDIDLKPESELVYKGYWDTEEAARAEHVGVYSKFREYHSTLWKMGEIRSDIWGGTTQETAYDQDLYNNDITTTKVPFSNWGGLYSMLHYINDFIDNASKSPLASKKSDFDHMMGQMYGMRAYIYYTMLRTWGEVPIATVPVTSMSGDISAEKKTRAEAEKVLDLIKSDIEKSLNYFGSNNSLWQGKNVYWSKSATLVLKGDVYIWSGKVKEATSGNATEDFTTAKQALSSITGYSLVSPYTNLWGEKNKNNSEFIFCIDYQVNQKESFYNASFTGQPRNINPTVDQDGQSLDGFNSTGQNRYGPSNKVRDLFLSKGAEDVRAKETFIFMYNVNADTQEKTYSGAILKKFLGEVVDGQRRSYIKVPLYRYADVLLLLAEAKNQLGEDPSTEINQIRQRAYAGNNGTSAQTYTNQSKEENQNAILQEGLLEFVGEGKRWWSLLRAGKDYVFKEVSTLQSGDEYKLYLPITQDMLKNDSALKQTLGYEK